ncbi:MAG: class I SAM-dependent methyltransferase, partial [Planctomycetota bacterium]
MSESDKSFFEDNVELYEGLVDWSKRLAREGPFYRRLFEENGVGRVLDVACGSGHHADMFHSWGLVVEGSDISEAMIAYCRDRFGESAGLSWSVRSFDETHPRPGSFDAAVCVGNSLELAGDYETVQKAIAALLGAVRSCGLCVI